MVRHSGPSGRLGPWCSTKAGSQLMWMDYDSSSPHPVPCYPGRDLAYPLYVHGGSVCSIADRFSRISLHSFDLNNPFLALYFCIL